ncbi:MAG: DNA repair protein RadC [Bacteroidales bacterium]|jgi:DNA repair protein RadC|nr:DNA repair protein RadC [Bacteroidales bacterium]
MSEILFLPIKEWAQEDRPREKFLLKGIAALSNAELIAILLATGSRHESAVDIAKRILHQAHNNVAELADFSIADLKKIKGIGEAKAITLLAAIELGRRRSAAAAGQQPAIRASRHIFDRMHPLLADLKYEEFHVLYLNRAHQLIADKLLSSGGIAGTIVDIKLIGKYAMEYLASALVLVHNHPSGNILPSEEDKVLTRKIKQAATFVDCTVIDHIIIAKNDYYSFADENVL